MAFENIAKAGSVVAAIAGIGTAYWAIDSRYAKDIELVAVEKRLDQKIVGDRFYELQRQLWELEDRYGAGCKDAPPRVKEMCRAVKKQLKEAQDELDALRKK